MRYFLIDRITRIVPGETAEGIKCVSLSDDVFEAHFPGHPIMPGALLIEAMAQLGGVLAESSTQNQHALLTMIDRAKFRVMVRPGDQVKLEATAQAIREEGAQVKAVARVDGKVVAEAELTFAFAQVTHPDSLKKRKEVLNIWLTGSAEQP